MNRLTLWPDKSYSFAPVPEPKLASLKDLLSYGLVSSSYLEKSSVESLEGRACDRSAITTPKRAKRGSKGITSYSRKMLRSAATLLEKEVGTRNLALLTTTLPKLTKPELKRVAEGSGQLTHLFLEKLKYWLKKAGIKDPQICYCLEVQEGRFKNYGEVVLHWHLLFQSKKPGAKRYAIEKSLAARLWLEALSTFIGREINSPAATRIEAVRQSASAYLGKYLSKGNSFLQVPADPLRSQYYPSAWSGATAKLKRRVKQAVVRASFPSSVGILKLRSQLSLCTAVKSFETFETGGGFFVLVGYLKAFNDATIKQLLDFIENSC